MRNLCFLLLINLKNYIYICDIVIINLFITTYFMEVNTNYPTPEPQQQQNETPQSVPTPQQQVMGRAEQCPPPGSIYEPISVGRYMLLILLAAIPVVNIIVYIIWAVSATNLNIRNYAKASLIWIVIGMGIVMFFFGGIVSFMSSIGQNY